MAKKNQAAGGKKLDVMPSAANDNLLEFTKLVAKNKVVLRDLKNTWLQSPKFFKYTKADISKYLSDPYAYEQHLRRAVIYMYGASPHFKRLIQYFVGLTDLSYIITPNNIDPAKTSKKALNSNYRKTLKTLNSMNIKTQFPKILTVCFREDVFYGTMYVKDGDITIQQLPSDYCIMSSIEGNVLNVAFDFSYFDSNKALLNFYPEEFTVKYELYKDKNRPEYTRWIELDSPTSFAIKCNNDILSYAMPPFAGILREIFDINDYKDLKLEKTELENYAMLVMKLPMDDEGNWQLDYSKAVDFWSNLDHVLPDEVGSVLSPMDVEKISFERSGTDDATTVSEAEESLFTAAGVSSLLFNNSRASGTALLLSIKADQSMTFNLVKSIEDMLNRFIQSQTYGKNFSVRFLDVSPFNRKEMADGYIKACQYGFPLISAYAATMGLDQIEMDSMNYLECDVLELQERFKPLRSSAQMGNEDSEGATDEGGRKKLDAEELSESRESNIESE